MSVTSNYISASDVVATVDTTLNSKVLFLPGVSSIYGKILTVKDVGGSASSNTITLRTALFDTFENGSNEYIINNSFGSLQLLAKSNYWYFLNTENGDTNTLSSIVSYGLSTVYGGEGVSSLSSIVAYGLSSVYGGEGISSLSSIVAYGLSSLLDEVNVVRQGGSNPGLSSLSSIVAYGLSSLLNEVNIVRQGASNPGLSSLSSIVAYGLSSIQKGISLQVITSSLYANYISSGIADFSTISTQTLLVGHVTSPLQVDVGVETPIIYTSNIQSYKGYFEGNVGIGRKAPFWYALDVAGDARFSGVISGDGSGLTNISETNVLIYNTGVSSLSSIVSYGLSSLLNEVNLVREGASNPGLSSLSSIVAYGLSTVNIASGISSLSSIVAYGLSTLYSGEGISSLSSIVAYGLSSLQKDIDDKVIKFSGSNEGVSSLSSIVSYGLSSVYGGYGVSSLSSIVAYGLSSLEKEIQKVNYGNSGSNEGVSSLSSIVAYGLSSVYGGEGISSLSSIVAYGLSSLLDEVNIVRQGASNPGLSSLSSIVAYGLSSLLDEVNVVRQGASNPGLSSLSSIVAYGLSSLLNEVNIVRQGASNPGLSTLSSIVAYGLSSIQKGISLQVITSSLYTNYISSGIADFSTISTQTLLVGHVTSPLQVDVGVETAYIYTSNIQSYKGYFEGNLGIGRKAPFWYALDVAGDARFSGVISGDGSGLRNISTSNFIIYHPGVSSLSSIVSYGLSSLLKEVNIVRVGGSNPGLSSLSSIVAYGLSSLQKDIDEKFSRFSGSNEGVSSLSSIVSYGLSSVHGGYGVSSLSSIVAYGLSSLQKDIDEKVIRFSGSNEGVSSLSSIVVYGLSSLLNEVNIVRQGASNPGLSSLSSIVAYGLSSIQKGITLQVITSSLYTNYISSGIADFSTISTQTLLVGHVTSPLQVDVGVETPIIYTSNIQSYKGYFEGNVGIGRKAPFWYALDVAGDARFSGKIIGDGGQLSNISIGNFQLPPNPGVSSLSSIVAYGISSLKKYVDDEFTRGSGGGGSSNSSNEGVSSLSSIVAYGLSTVGLIQNPTVGPFIDAWRGGAGISSLASLPEKPDTITDAVAKIDNWLFKNIIAQPPTPIQSNSDIKGTFAKLLLVPPFQIKSGLLNQWLPAIYSIQADVYAKSNYSLIYSIVLSNSALLPKGESNFNGFYFDGQFVTACNISYFGYTDSSSTSNLYYIPLGSNLKINASYQIDIYYRNHSMESVNILSNEWLILRGFQPAAPYNLLLNNPTYDSIYTGFTLSNIDCNNPSQGIGNGANYLNAFITLSNSTSRQIPRRYGLGFTSYSQQFTVSLPSDATLNTYILCNIVGLPADTYLSFNVYTTNSLSQNDGLISSNSYYSNTALPPDGGRLNNVTYNSGGEDGNYPVSGIPVNKPRTNVVQVLCNSVIVAQGGFSNIINNNRGLAIHTIETPGNSNTTPIASLQVTTATDSNTFFFRGWSDTLQSGGTSNSANSRITVGAIQDVYPGSQYLSNFYLQASNVSVVISNAYFTTAGANGITFSIIGSNLSNANIIYDSQTYYSDSLTGAPSLTQFSNALDLSNAGRFQYVTGVLSLGSNVVFDFKADVANWACNFYPACNTFLTASYSGGVDGTSNLSSNTLIYNNTDSSEWTGLVPNPARFQLSNTSFAGFGTILTSNRDSQIIATLRVNTLTTSESVLRCNIPYYFDIASINRINSLLGGTRFLAISNTYPEEFISFCNTCNITSNSENPYGYELPLLGGFYRSGCNLGVTYRNFTDFEIPKGFVGYEYPTSYANISNETGIRYAMFKFSLSNETTTHYVKLLQFNINRSVGFNNIGINCNFNSQSIHSLWYKIDNINSCNTGWLDGNLTKESLESFPSSEEIINETPGLRSNSFNTPINGVQRYFSIIPIAPRCNFDVYVKIGIKMNCNINFDYINISNIYGSNNPAPTRLNISNIGNIDSNILDINWSNVSIPDLYTGLFAPILANFASITSLSNVDFPRRYGNYVIDDTKFIFTLDNNSNTQIFASNYDTNYRLTIYSVNDLGISTNPSVNSSSIIYRTSLPSNSGAFYKNGNIFSILNTYNCNYPITNTIYTNSDPRNEINTVINMNQAFSIDGTIQIRINNMPFTVNPESNRVGSNLSKVTFYLQTVNNNNYTNTIDFQFNNDMYNESTLYNVGPDNKLRFEELSDEYYNNNINIKAGNFFLKVTNIFYYSLLNNKITASNMPYKFIMSNDQGCNIASPNYYFDNFPTAARAGISNIFVDTSRIDSTYYSYVSGLAVFNTSCNYNLWIAASNLGSNFFINPPVAVRLVDGVSDTILGYPFDIDSSKLYSNSNTGSIMTDTVQNTTGQTFLYWTDVNLSNSYGGRPIFTVNNPFSNIGSAFNINGLSAAPTNFVFGDSSNRKFYFDSASVLLRDATKNSNYVSGALNYGLRVESGAGLYPTLNTTGVTNDSLFGFSNIDSNLLTVAGGYSNELQLVNGQYTASNPGIAYLNYSTRNLYIPTGYSGYPDYSQIVTTGDRRYATFMWYINSTNVTNFIYFTINNINFLTNTGSDLYTLYTGGITVHYCIVKNNNYPPSVNNGTSAWLNGNVKCPSTLPLSAALWTTHNTGGLLNGQTINGVQRNNDRSNRIVRINNNNNTVGSGQFNFFVRIGIPINCNFSFNSVKIEHVQTN